jgi:hypothetical protein
MPSSHKVIAACCFLLLLGWGGPIVASAQDLPDQPAAVISVVAVRHPDWKPYLRLYKGAQAFSEHQALAPQAKLRWRLRAKSAGTSMADLELQLVSGDSALPIALDKNGTFELPEVPAGLAHHYELRLNKKKDLFGWEPYIHSPGYGQDKVRLGDLRLTCEVSWAIEQDDMPFLLRSGLKLMGGPCTSTQGTVDFGLDRRIGAAELRMGERTLSVFGQRAGPIIIPPLADKSWPDDSEIWLTVAAAHP